MFLEFAGPFYKKYPPFDVWFSPLPEPRGTLRVCQKIMQFFIKAKLLGTFWKVIFILRTSMIRCIPWPPGPKKRRSEYPLYAYNFFFHIPEGEEGKDYEPYKFLLLHFVKDEHFFNLCAPEGNLNLEVYWSFRAVKILVKWPILWN